MLTDENLAHLSRLQQHLRARTSLIAASFLVGLIIGIPTSANIIRWLLTDAGLVPADTNIITLTPVEFILLQVQFGAWFGTFLVIFFLVLEGAWRAKIWSHVRSPGLLVTSTAFSVLILASGGIYYAFEWLTPMLLDYLQKDAQAAGLTTEWRLNGFIGFILNLSVACAIGFQAPVLTLLAIRTDLVKREDVILRRRHIWFGTFILSAAISPPDPLSLFLVALPIILLFESSLAIDRIMGEKQSVSA